MALEEFWNDVRSRNPLFRNPISPPDAPRITPEELDAELRKNEAAWCPRGPLRGFDARDFDFLSPEDLNRLSGWVTAFNAIALELKNLWSKARNPGDEKRLKELIELAVNPLRELLLFMAHDRYLDADAFRFGKLVEHELGDQLPEGVVELRFLVGQDWSGDPGLFTWVILWDNPNGAFDDETQHNQLAEIVNRVSPMIRDAARQVAPDYFPYVSFRGISERVGEEAAA